MARRFARALAALLFAATLLLYLAGAWLRPDLLPEPVRGPPLALEFRPAYAAWQAALKRDPTEAAAIADELKLGARWLPWLREHERDAEGMGLLARRRGGEAPSTAEARGDAWLLERLAARRPHREWAVLAAALVALLAAPVALLLKPREPQQTGGTTSIGIGPRALHFWTPVRSPESGAGVEDHLFGWSFWIGGVALTLAVAWTFLGFDAPVVSFVFPLLLGAFGVGLIGKALVDR